MHHYSQRLPQSRPQGSQTANVWITDSKAPKLRQFNLPQINWTIFDISGIQEVWHRIFNSPNYLYCSKSLELPFISSSSLLCWIGCSTAYWVSHQEMIALIGALQLVLCMDIHAPSKCDSRNLQLHFAMSIPTVSTVFGLYPLCSSMHRRDAKTLKVDVILTIWIDRDPDRHLMFFATLWAGQLVSTIICYEIVLMPLHAFFGQQQQKVVATGTVPSPSSASIPMALTKDQQT